METRAHTHTMLGRTNMTSAFLNSYPFVCQVIEKGGKMPLKWLPVESLFKGDFSQASDVWAFGVVVCWVMPSARGGRVRRKRN